MLESLYYNLSRALFLTECHKSKTKVITLSSDDKKGELNERIRTPSKCMYQAPSTQNTSHQQASRNWFCFYFSSVNRLKKIEVTVTPVTPVLAL